jgi:DNA polymerase
MAQDNGPLELLKWYIEAGVDEALDDVPVDRLAAVPEPAAPAPSSPTPMSGPPTQEAVPSPTPAFVPGARQQPVNLVSRDAIRHGAREAATAAKTLDELRTALTEFEGCELKQTAKSLVFGDGEAGARLMIVGEAPGAEEDRQGLPFVGPAGKMLERMLAAIGLQRSDVYITNVVPWRPPGNRTPTDAEIGACLPFIERHIELVDPQILVMVGGASAKSLLGLSQGIMRLRGKWYDYESLHMASPIAARAILHPAYLLRTPAQKRDTWLDLIDIRKKLAEKA